jgi:TP901 family phage tail tape measure protein
MAALREILASFTVEVDPSGALPKGEKSVDALASSMRQMDAIATSLSASVSKAFAKMSGNIEDAAESVEAAVRRAAQAAQKFSALGNLTGMTGPRDGSSAWAQLGQLARQRDAPMGAQFGPVRPTAAQNLGARAFNLARGAGGALGGIGATAKSALGAVNSLRFGLAALGAGAAVSGVMRVIDQLGSIGEAASKLGVTNAEFQRLDVLAKQNATSVGALGTAFRTLATNAVNPTEESTEALRKLGVQVKADDGTFKSRQDLFFETAGALADVEDGTVRAALAQKLYGRSAIELAPLLANGRAGLEAQRAELEKLPVATDSAIAAADALGDRWASVQTELLGRFAPLLEETIIPAFQTLTTWFLKGAEAVAGFLKESNYLTYLGTFLRTLATPLRVMFRVFQSLFGLKGGDWFASLADGIGRAATAFATLLNLPFLLAKDFQYYLDGRDSLIGRTLKALTEALSGAWDAARPRITDFFNWTLQQAQTYGVQIARALVPGFVPAELIYNAVTGANDTVPVPGGAAGGAPAERQGTTVVEAPRTVTINMGQASPADVAKRVGVELRADRNALVAGTP